MADWFDHLDFPPPQGGWQLQQPDTAAQPQPAADYSGANSGWSTATQANAPALLALYQKYYGTSAPPIADFNANLANPSGMAAVEAAMKADPSSLVNRPAAPFAAATPPPTTPTSAAPSPAQTFAPSQALSLPQMAAPTPMPRPTPYTLPTAADVASTPGYQFTRDQGIQGVEHSDIARGLGLGGAALKDIGQYTTGLADQFYGNRVQQGMAASGLNFGQGLATNQNNFGQTLATNQFNSGNQLNQFGANLGANQQFWGQGLAENQNAYNQYRGLQNDAFNQWLSLANLGNPGNPYG